MTTPDDAEVLEGRLQEYADDPMWADHAEVHKITLRKMIAFIRASRERERLLCDLIRQRTCPSDGAMTTGQCIDTRRCGCSAGLFAALPQPEASK